MGSFVSRPSVGEARADMDTLRREELVLEAAANPRDEFPPSCLTLFDRWLTCYALGPQFRSIYRYGTIADCAPRREDFKYCLTLRSLEPEERRAKWLERRAEAKAHKRKGFRSSEAVCDMRREPLMDPALVDPAYPLCTYHTRVRRICFLQFCFRTADALWTPIPKLTLNDAHGAPKNMLTTEWYALIHAVQD